jgi:hypothetical protein
MATLAGCQELINATNASTINAQNEARSQQDDGASWRNVPLIELETHPLFSTMPRRIDSLSDGSQLWNVSGCKTFVTDTRCSTYPIGSVAYTQCNGGQVVQSCCIRQFRVRDQRIESFRQTGNCITGCQVRPGGCTQS